MGPVAGVIDLAVSGVDFSGDQVVRFNAVLTSLALVAVLAAGPEAQAQRFGSRTLRNPLSRAARPGSEEVGTLQGNERFIRGNRRGGDFVGTDSQDRNDFVGSQQAPTSGQVRSAVSDLRERPGATANRSQRPYAGRSRGMYAPQMRVGFKFTPRSPVAIHSALARRLNASAAIRPTSPIGVSLEGRTATLQGEVASERDRILAQQLALFEPGISAVRNELTVKAPPPPAQRSPPADQPPGVKDHY